MSFHAHFEDDRHCIGEWEITLIDQKKNVDNPRKRESFWQYQLDTFKPNGLNESDVSLFSCVYLLSFYVVFIFSSLTHYTYCSTIISIITLHILFYYLPILSLLLIIVIILLLLLPLLFNFLYVFHLKFIYIFMYLLTNTWICST